MVRKWSAETRGDFYGLVGGGWSVKGAAAVLGVSRTTGAYWWDKSAPMELRLVGGRAGGLAGSTPSSTPIPCPAGREVAGREVAGRGRRPLSSEDRAVIAAGRARRLSFGQIAELIGRDKSVVWREVRRNTGPDGAYWAPLAHRAAHERRRRPKPFKLAEHPGLCHRIEAWMDDGWSPKLIAEVLRRDHPQMIMDRVSHETIYQALYVQTRGRLRADLHRQLSLKRAARKPHDAPRKRSWVPEEFRISRRPAEVADRAVPGHWEGDLILGTANGSAVGTLVERSTRFTILLHLPGRHDAASVSAAMIAEMGRLPEHLRRSLTWDRGSEMADFDRIRLELKMPVYFCDPHSPWQRGSNENTNRLLRFWLEKGTDLSVHTAEDLRRISATLNKRPRPTLDLQTPAQRLAALLSNPPAA